jgi:hypothetical protein
VTEASAIGTRLSVLTPLGRIYAVAITIVISLMLAFAFGRWNLWLSFSVVLCVAIVVGIVERRIRRRQNGTPTNSA